MVERDALGHAPGDHQINVADQALAAFNHRSNNGKTPPSQRDDGVFHGGRGKD